MTTTTKIEKLENDIAAIDATIDRMNDDLASGKLTGGKEFNRQMLSLNESAGNKETELAKLQA